MLLKLAQSAWPGAPAPLGDEGDDGDPAHASHAIGMAARNAFRDMADRSYTTLRFGPAGLVIDGHMTFKQ